MIVSFSLYLFCLYAAAGATVPVGFLFAGSYLRLNEGTVVVISGVVQAATAAGYFTGGHLADAYGARRVLLLGHFLFAVINLLLLLLLPTVTAAGVIVSVLLAGYGFTVAMASIAVSSELMALAPRHNKAMAMALCFTCYSAGVALSRLVASLFVGHPAFAAPWNLLGRTVTGYHRLFLVAGVTVLALSAMLFFVPSLRTGDRNRPA